MIGFEWDDQKAAANLRHHEVNFEDAARACRDPFAVEWIDSRQPYGEERVVLLGRFGNIVLYVAYTDVVKIYASSQPVEQRGMSKTTTIARTRRDGPLSRILPGGGKQPAPSGTPAASRGGSMTDEEVYAAALDDPDAQPLSDQDMAQLRQVPRAKTLRRALGLTQEEFAARYQIPVGTLRDWEQGRAEPDQPARAYLKAIAGDPEAILRALAGARRSSQ